jgi:hypothetical protein
MTYSQLSSEERYFLSSSLARGRSIPSIAKEMDRSPRTLFRELRRKRRPSTCSFEMPGPSATRRYTAGFVRTGAMADRSTSISGSCRKYAGNAIAAAIPGPYYGEKVLSPNGLLPRTIVPRSAIRRPTRLWVRTNINASLPWSNGIPAWL